MDAHITFCGNSGFLVAVEQHLMIFDYVAHLFKQSFVDEQLLQSYETVTVFCSHGHFDHYQEDTLNWQHIRPDIHYIFSDDIVIHDHMRPPHFSIVQAGDSLLVNDWQISCYESTDLGVAFDIQKQDFRFFHAGDLNDWHWLNEHNTDWTTEQAKRFRHILDGIPKEPPLSIACFPVDARMQIDYYRGAREFIRAYTPQYMIPMHFGSHFETEFNPPEPFWTDVNGFTNVQAVYKPGDQLFLTFDKNI